jgi:hypothetical protein
MKVAIVGGEEEVAWKVERGYRCRDRCGAPIYGVFAIAGQTIPGLMLCGPLFY